MSFVNPPIPSIVPSSSSSTLTSPIITSSSCEHINNTDLNFKQQQDQNNVLTPIKNFGSSTTTTGTSSKESLSSGSCGGKQQLLPPKSFCILTPCSNSHPFEERRIPVTRSEENAVKIGRSIVRLQPAHNNAIFDCKVLSRNHAILWMNDDGHFLIKDTRSSNGTFINNERLSQSGEESDPKELYSGDILQLGVEIVDNTKKVASGCVTCIVRLTNERGEEYADRPQMDSLAFPIRNENQIPLNYTLVRNDKLFIFEQYIKEAKFKENLIGQKLETIEGQLLAAQVELQAKWDENINQELLLSRIELLETQLTFMASKNVITASKNGQTTSSNPSEKDEEENNFKRELRELIEDRAKTEQLAKESLRKKCEQMQESVMRLKDVEMGLVNVEEENSFLKQRCADYDLQLVKQRENYDMLMLKYNEVCAQLVTAEKAAVVTSEKPQSSPPQQILENGGDVNEDKSSPKKEIVKKLNMNENKEDGKIQNIFIDDEKSFISTKSSEDHQKTNYISHNCKEKELLEQLKNLKIQLLKLKNEGKFNEEGIIEEGNNLTTIQSSTTSADFQVFLFSIFPFLLVLLLILAPFFYFNSLWTNTNNESTMEIDQFKEVYNREEEENDENMKKEEEE